MNQTKVLSSEDFNEEYFDFDTSLSDIGETISLYEYDYNDQSQNSKRLTWEEWYIKKKLEKFRNEKKMQNDMKNVSSLA
ncbi:hypothetical protein BpHYR1_003553 [Brachionus plicatilis]|uniref:Uncharacterized protein n=1 Tax=Brachionus plicatilis TaxID=10195 RepID=A0A3M7QDL3_BRAPC|nr:hypothetical protein BpHYR1_003553 [Brachionus plicatilis]